MRTLELPYARRDARRTQLINFGDGTGRSTDQPLWSPEGRDQPRRELHQTMLQILDYLKARMSTTERGAAAVEYGMLVALIAAVIVGVVGILGGKIDSAFHAVSD